MWTFLLWIQFPLYYYEKERNSDNVFFPYNNPAYWISTVNVKIIKELKPMIIIKLLIHIVSNSHSSQETYPLKLTWVEVLEGIVLII